ncbi:hypothetical protein Pfo_027208 [Paulownia fortunei]|nr:hypothetical protein Pfo_027208 [Paulownia fortunei]
MHAIKGGWVGQAFALATSNDAGGKKSRIRRSKEERKMMVESFIKKYQKSNDGNFPSLNLTHKEVGGSFYTVREIVREIIQENRVLAPPKVSLEEHDHSGFLEQHPLGTISLEPRNDLSVSDGLHIVTPIVPNQYSFTNEELISSSSLQFLRPDPLELNNEQNVNGLNKVAEKDEGLDTASHPVPNRYQETSREEISNSVQQLPRPKIDKFENEKIVNGGEGLEENIHSDKPLITNAVPIHHQDNNNESELQSTQKIYALGSQRRSDEQYLNKNEQTVDTTKESGQLIYMESVDMEILDREKDGGKDVEVSQAVTSHVNTNFVVETFPLRPVSRTILDLEGESGKLHEAAGALEDRANKHDEMAFVKSNSDLYNEKDEEKHLGSTLKLNGQYRDEKAVLNLQEPSFENSKLSTTFKATLLDVGDVKGLESSSSLPDETKDSGSTVRLISEDSTAVRIKSSGEDENGLQKGSSPMLDRINLETWEEASKQSTRPESNPLLTLVKAFISAFMKFWTE